MDQNRLFQPELLKGSALLDLIAFVMLAGLLCVYCFRRKKKRGKGTLADRFFIWATVATIFSTLFDGLSYALTEGLYAMMPASAFRPALKICYGLFILGAEASVLLMTVCLLMAVERAPQSRKQWTLFCLPFAVTILLMAACLWGDRLLIVNTVSFSWEPGRLYYPICFTAPTFYLLYGLIRIRRRYQHVVIVLLLIYAAKTYFAFASPALSVTPFALAIALQYVRSSLREHRMLMQVGGVVFFLFMLISLLIGNAVTSVSLSTYLNTLGANMEYDMDALENDLLQYQALPWLMNRWMDFGDTITQRLAEAADAYPEFSSVSTLCQTTVDEAEAMPPEKQLAFAAACYGQITEAFVNQTVGYYNMMDNSLLVRKTDGDFLVLVHHTWKETPDLHPGDTISRQELTESMRRYSKTASPSFLNWALTEHTEEEIFGFTSLIISRPEQEILLIVFNRVFTEEINYFFDFMKGFRWVAMALLLGSGTLILLMMRFIILRPLTRMKNTLVDYRRRKDTSETVQRLTVIQEDSLNEAGLLSLAFASLLEEMNEYTAEVADLAAQREHALTELNTARDIQLHNLPTDFTLNPPRKEVEFFATMHPARMVGGDFYDFFPVDENHLALVMADVSGKGVPAALFMMSSRWMIQSAMLQTGSPAEALRQVNDQICANNPDDMFVTVWLGMLDLCSGRLTAANAGHEYPALARNGLFSLYNDPHGLVIGWMEGSRYDEYTIQLEPGDQLFLYTDGVTEATGADGQMFGETRMVATLNSSAEHGDSPPQVLQRMNDAVESFVNDTEQFDDLTMMCVAWHGPQAPEQAAPQQNTRE